MKKHRCWDRMISSWDRGLAKSFGPLDGEKERYSGWERLTERQINE